MQLIAKHPGVRLSEEHRKDTKKIKAWLKLKGYTVDDYDAALGWHLFCEEHMCTSWAPVSDSVFETMVVIIADNLGDDLDEQMALNDLLKHFVVKPV